jgi:membrane protein DedA with SNARE-associated domain
MAFISDQDNLAGLGVLAGAAMVEYVFPPFPGDTITLFGAVLITAKGWSAPLVLGAVVIGALLGTALDWGVGRWLAGGRRVPPRWQARLDRLAAAFQRHGAAYLFVARFLPAMRSLSCVASGLAGMRLPVVLLWSGLATLIYNALLALLGAAVGANLDELRGLVARYSLGATIALAAVALVVGFALWRRGRRGAAPPT